MKMETFLRLPPLSPLSPVIPGIVVDDDDVTNDERRVDDDVFIATLDSRESLFANFCCLFDIFVVRKNEQKTHKTAKKSVTRICTNDDDVLPSPTQPPRVRGVYHRYY